ncbi:hypothetical protein LAU_0045 [Lausannevirus]|uniref:Uncharacterized protein n=2 Tax=Lausannevirus TaxID=999883 RepID=A0A0N9PU61_9VIRU|nr:hypothetical protein LAU_0045 [Lausannevirus]AEA06901.1 hypothetical protein LAU_0045 [Lausannevirus]ALH06741.1 hypothetical protein PMV_043 [Port-miou virus]
MFMLPKKMSSIYLEEVQKFLKEEFNIGKDGVTFTTTDLGRGETRVFCNVEGWHGDAIYWDEFLLGGSCVDMLHTRMKGSKEEKLGFLKKQLGNILLNSNAVEVRKQMTVLREENEKLKSYISRLREKKRELKYTPGKRGASNAQEHFQSLC